jgi:hypothetical protein
MSAQAAPLNRQTARRFVRAVKDLLTSEVRAKAIGLLVLEAQAFLHDDGRSCSMKQGSGNE